MMIQDAEDFIFKEYITLKIVLNPKLKAKVCTMEECTHTVLPNRLKRTLETQGSMNIISLWYNFYNQI